MKIVIWGNELTAWVTAGAFAQSGNDVFIVNDTQIDDPIDLMGNSIRKEAGLKDLIVEEFDKTRLQFIQSGSAAQFSTHIFAMNPAEFDTAHATLSRIAKCKHEKLLIINQSHFGVGSTDKLQAMLTQPDHVVAYLAENIAEGDALNQFRHPKSITLGCENAWAETVIRALWRPFNKSLEQLLVMTPREAEFAKLAITGMLALRLGYINELANVAEQLNVDIDVVRQSMGADKRIGQHYLSPGCGFGGNSFSQITKGLANLLSEKRQSHLLDAVLAENEKQKEQPFRKLWRHYDCDIHNLNIAIWGASFKPGSSSLDNAPSLKVINAILAQQANVRIHDPDALENIDKLYGGHPQVVTCKNKYDALENADALILLTEWPEYWSPDYEAMTEQMRAPVIIDGRNVFSPELVKSLGFTYYGVGR
jgi:UDPglucose 6-dehydrogenase